MEVWQTLEFGAKAYALQSLARQSREEVLRVQRSRLEELVRRARERSAFYRDKFASISGSSFALADLPTTTKAEIMENFEDALTVDDVHRDEVEAFFDDEANLGRYFRDKYVLSHTSGSQGQPLLIVQPKDNIELLFALQIGRGNHRTLNAWEAVKHLIVPARLAVIILKRGFYPSACAFEYMPESAKSYLELLHLSMTDDNMLERLTQFRPTHLTAYASVLHELAREIEAGRLSLKPDLEQVVNISERLVPQAREHYSQVFGAPILDNYSMGECLFLTHGCPTSGGMHLNADWAALEVVDEDNQPVPDGTKGAKVLITNLANYVQPIIRYEIGDLVTMAPSHNPSPNWGGAGGGGCGCGSNLPLIAGIEGRDSDVFWIEDEAEVRPLSPAVFEVALGRVADVREYQLIQEEPNRIRVLVEPLPGVDVDRQRVNQTLQKVLQEYELHQRLRYEVKVVERLTPESGDKFKRVISKVDKSAGPC